ncbi:MAG: hypothetical protein DLM59_13810 [Pseudonocardiales bacterium]|nr:MAG: hypothetical protein DLM59_13810 [Pseudonocardiales bacterium]
MRAAAVAATVAEAVVMHARATAEAATIVAAAVAAAAETAALAANAAAAAVEGEAVAAALTGEAVAASTADTATAAGAAAVSTERVTDIVVRLKVVAALRDSENRFRVTFEHASVGMMLVSLNCADLGRVLRVNPAMCDLSGRTDVELLGLTTDVLVHSEERATQEARLASLSAGETSNYQAVSRWKHADGRDVWVRVSLYAVREDEAAPEYAVGQVEDITEDRRAEAALRVREERFRLAFDNAGTGMMFLDVEGRLQKANQAMFLLLGFAERDLLGRFLNHLVSEGEGASIRAGIADLVAGEVTVYQAEHSFPHADGHLVWGLLSGSVVQDEDGRPHDLVLQVEDVTARKQAEIQLAHQALHDDLTGLPNRILLTDHLSHACSRAERAGKHVAVLFLDIDDFKEINDTLGHVAGDHVLTLVAERLSGCLREADTAARLGGDEFVVVCEDLTDSAEAVLVAERVERALAVPVTVGGNQIEVGVSIGIASAGGGAQPEDLLRCADTAMYQAKSNGKGRYEVFDPAMRVGALRQLTLARDLSFAIIRDELRLHYQPTYDLRSGAVVGVEALLRWQHPARGLLTPAEFLDVAEGRRLMIPIGDWVVRTASVQATIWQQAFGDLAPDMWVNISSQQLGKQHLTAVVEQTLAETGLTPGKLGLEVTERQLIGGGEAVRSDLLALQDLGLRLAIDDFGTGFNSLEYLRRFRFDEIKIDRSFISGLGRDRTDTAVTASVIALGGSLDLVVVAEGVETRDQYESLRALGCDLAQGYLLQRPGPPEVIDLVLATAAKLPTPIA